MAKKSNSRKSKKNQRNRTLSKVVSVLIIIFVVLYFLYKNVPPFHDFVDEQAAKAKTAVEKIFNKNDENKNQDSTQIHADENRNQDSTRINTDEHGFSRISESEKQIETAQAQNDEKRNETQNQKSQTKNNEILNQVQNDEKRSETQNQKSQTKVSSKSELVSLPQNLEFPLCAGANHAADHERRNYEYYSICYRESYEQAEWSAYCLTSEHLVKNASRSDDFRPDPEISTGSASLADYKGSGYDRGHLSPAADFAFDKTAMSETFYMSNMSPQAGGLNRGIWKDLEATVRNWASEFGRVYVVSGPILEKPAEDYESIGKDKVSVPQYYYKVLLAPLYADEKDRETPDDAKNVIAIGFIFPNEKCDGDIFDYAVSIDEVEKRTGINFFNELEDDIEDKIEAEVDVKDWE